MWSSISINNFNPSPLNLLHRCTNLQLSLCIWSVYHSDLQEVPGLGLILKSLSLTLPLFFCSKYFVMRRTFPYLPAHEQSPLVQQFAYSSWSGRCLKLPCLWCSHSPCHWFHQQTLPPPLGCQKQCYFSQDVVTDISLENIHISLNNWHPPIWKNIFLV